MKAYDCEGTELSIGDDVIYVGNIINVTPDLLIGKVYKILNIVNEFDIFRKNNNIGIRFDCHPFPNSFITKCTSSLPKFYKKIDYSNFDESKIINEEKIK